MRGVEEPFSLVQPIYRLTYEGLVGFALAEPVAHEVRIQIREMKRLSGKA